MKQITNEEIARVRQRTHESDATEPRAKNAYYDAGKRRVIVELCNGSELAVPARLIEGMARASARQIAAVEVLPSGKGLHWEELDIDLSVPAMVAGVFGSKAWHRALASRMGSSTSPAKAAAARRNGEKGGRPRKKPLVAS